MLGREMYGYGAQARTGVFGAEQDLTGAVSAAGLGEMGRVFDASQVRNAAVGAAQDAGRAGRFVAGQQRDAMIAEGAAARDVGRFNAQNAYDLAMAQAQQGLLQGTVQSQIGFEESMADAWAAQNLGQFQTESLYAGAQAEAQAARGTGMFGAQQELYQSIFEALQQQQAGAFAAGETATAGIFDAGETATAGMFDAGQQADADTRALEQSRFEQMMQLAMSEASGLAELQGDLAQGGLTRDLAINAATQKAEAAAASGMDVMQSWFAPGSYTETALSSQGYTPYQIAGFDNTTLRAIVSDYTDQVDFQNQNVQTRLPWDQRTYYNYPEEGLGEFRQGSAFEQQLGMDPEGAGMGLQDYAASLDFQPWQDPISYSNPAYASGNYPGSYGYQQETPWRPSSPQGVAFDVGFIGPGGPVVTNMNALKQYAASVGMPYPDVGGMGEADRDPAISNWYTTVLEASLAPAP
jgi:hypothetical protein